MVLIKPETAKLLSGIQQDLELNRFRTSASTLTTRFFTNLNSGKCLNAVKTGGI